MLLGLLWSSCSNEEGIIPPSSPEKAASELRTPEEAIALADNLFASRTEGTRASSRTVKAVSIIGSASGRSASDTLIYAINYADNGGFALVSAVPEGIDIIGYADEGNFDVEKIEPGSNVEYFLDAAKNYVSARGISIGDGQLSIRGTILYTNGTVSSRCSRWNGARTTPKAFIALTKLPDVYRLPWRR